MIESNDLKILEEEKRLSEKSDSLDKIWREAVDKALDISEYKKTKPLFDQAIEAHQAWQKYRRDHYNDIFSEKKK